MNTKKFTRSQVDRIAVCVEEAAEMLSLGRSTVYDLLKDGSLVSVKVGNRRLISVKELRAFLERLGTKTTA